jgi:hypothetical protein
MTDFVGGRHLIRIPDKKCFLRFLSFDCGKSVVSPCRSKYHSERHLPCIPFSNRNYRNSNLEMELFNFRRLFVGRIGVRCFQAFPAHRKGAI